MIECLDGIFETVQYKSDTSLKLYENWENENYPAHWHVTMEIIMPEENIYTVETPEQKVILREGDIIFLAPGCIHTLYAPSTGKRIIFQPNISSFRFLGEIESLITIISPMIVIRPEDYPNIYPGMRSLLLEIREIYRSGRSYSEIEIYSRVLQMLSLIGQTIAQDNVSDVDMDNFKKDEYFDKFLKICDYINDHFAEEITLEEVAKLSGFNKFYFSKLFKQFAGISFYKYVSQRRISAAELMLVNPMYSITDVALNCGFSSLSTFIRMFKLTKGCTPTEFRKMYRACRVSK